jgi:flagellar hook assembly protein FlgD
VDLEIFDLRGRRVRTLSRQAPFAAGEHRVTWDGRDDSGRAAGSGVYLARARARDGEARTRFVLVR